VKILVLGAAGMAGHVVALSLRDAGFEVDTLSAHNKLDDVTKLVDVTDQLALKDVLDNADYDVVVNCIGLLVKQSEERKDLAAYINGYLPHFLEHFYKDSETRLIHLSTDCVFSGKNPPYREDSMYDGEIFYDRSKALGEIINDKDLTFRMSIVGPELRKDGIGLFNWFNNQTGEISGFTGAMWSGVTTIELAKGIVAAINQNLTGLYQLVPDDNISKFELLNLFKDAFQRDDITVTPSEAIQLDKTLLNTRTDFDFNVSSYTSMVHEMKQWIENHSHLYPHYERKQ
jgi:dTDP-4-dehydrorhamnose reductase